MRPKTLRTMAASSAGRALSLMMLLLRLASISHHLRAADAIGGGETTPITSYRPTSSSSSSSSSSFGAEEPWVAEEVFRGASSESRRDVIERREKRGVKRGSDRPSRPSSSSSSFPGHESLGERSWWDDDDDDDHDDHDDHDERRLQVTSPSISARDDAGSPRGKKRHRLNVWKKFNIGGKGNATSSSSSSTTSSGGGDPGSPPTDATNPNLGGLPSSEYDEEHPMRTDEWQLDIRLSRLYPAGEGDFFPECDVDGTTSGRRASNDRPQRRKGTDGSYRKRQVMQFARNGYVRVIDDERSGGGGDASGGGGGRRNKPRVGKWRIGHSGVAFDIPVPVANGRRKRGGGGNNDDDDALSRRMTVLHYHAEIHLNKFGERPRMFRGVITRDRHSSFLPPNFLRPVIGTFSAEGIGHDTSDTTYKERAISLSRQHAINEARGFAQ